VSVRVRVRVSVSVTARARVGHMKMVGTHSIALYP